MTIHGALGRAWLGLFLEERLLSLRAGVLVELSSLYQYHRPRVMNRSRLFIRRLDQ